MKKIKIFIALLFTASLSFANYTGTVTTSQSELTFSINSGYNVASFKGRQYTNTVGAPQMPVKTLSFLIPIDQKVSSIVINSTTVQQIAGSYTIYPVQTPIPTTLSAASAGFDNPNPSIYNSTNPYPGITYSTNNDGYPMGYHVVTVNFYPLQFVPASHILNLYTSINFTIVYASNTDNVLRPNKQSVYSNNLSKEYIKGMVSNPNDLGIVTGGAKEVVANNSTSTQNVRGMSPINLNTIPDYIIITNNAFIGTSTTGFQKLANWKTQKGVNTLIVKTSDIYSNYAGYDNAEKIRNYLKDVFVNFGSSYVLLGGDVKDAGGAELVPTRFAYIENYKGDVFKETDYYYATVQKFWNDDGDNLFGEDSDFPDMSRVFFVGRAPVQTIAEASNFTNKIINYENVKDTNNVQLSNLNYSKNLCYWLGLTKAHPGYGPFAYTNLDAMDAMDGPSGLIPSSKYHVLKLYDSTETYPGSFVINSVQAMNSLNTGWSAFGQSYGMIHIFYHLDHSGPEGMTTGTTIGGGGVGVGQMDALTKGSYYSIFYSDGCDVNSFASNSSVSKHFINKTNGGGVAFIGNTSYGYGGDDRKFRDYFMDALYGNTAINSTLQKYNNARYHIGFLNWYTSLNLWNANRYFKSVALLGDPEMMVWTDTPLPLTLTSTYSATNKNITGTISGLSFAATPTVVVTITVWKGSEIYQTKDINATTASVAYTLSNVFAHTTGNITVTATAHNYIPKVNTINVSSISGAHPYMTSYVINDDGTTGSVGNSDHFPDAGETIALPVTLTNSGNAPATTVTAKLTWKAGPYQTQTGTNATITINPTYSVSTFGNIVASGTANNNTSPFRFTVNKNAFEGITPRPLTQFIKFALSVLVNSTTFSTDTFVVQITEPNLVKGENTVTGTLAANSTNNQLRVKLYNAGLSTAMLSGVANAGVLSKTSTNITLTTSTSTYPNITGINTSANVDSNATTFKFNMGGSAYTNQTFTLTVTDKYAKIWKFPFNLVKPVVNTVTSTMGHLGYVDKIEPFWNIQLTSGTAKGYNIYRSLTSTGAYTKINTNILPYSSYVDLGLSLLTVYYYKVGVVDNNGNESVLFPSAGYPASTTPINHAGWPVTPEPTSNSITGGRCEGSPITYDLLGDGRKEIFFTSGYWGQGGVWAFNNDGSRWYQYDGTTLINGYINFQKYTSASPAMADIDNDGNAELTVTTIEGSNLLTYESQLVQGQAPSLKSSNSIPGWLSVKGAVYSDLDNDGKLEVLSTTMANVGVKVFDSNGSPHAGAGWLNTTGYNCGFTMPVAFDFNGDGKKEIVLSTTGGVTHPAGIYIYNEDGTNYGVTNPVYTPIIAGDRTDSPPVIADINNDGVYEILFISGQGYTANVYAINSNGTPVSGWNTSNHTITLKNNCKNDQDTDYGLSLPTLSVGDLDKDGRLEVICGDSAHLYVWNYMGTLLKDIAIPGYAITSYTAPIIADVDSISTDLEIIVSGAAPLPSNGSNIYAYKMNGQLAIGFPITIPTGIGNTPCVDDIDNNGTNELIVTTGSKFYVWDTKGLSSNNVYGWTSYRHDNLNSGVFNSAGGGVLIGNDDYLQNTTQSDTPNNLFRYYTGQNILAGDHVTNKKLTGPVLFKNGSTVILEGTKSVLLDTDVTIETGCIFEIK